VFNNILQLSKTISSMYNVQSVIKKELYASQDLTEALNCHRGQIYTFPGKEGFPRGD